MLISFDTHGSCTPTQCENGSRIQWIHTTASLAIIAPQSCGLLSTASPNARNEVRSNLWHAHIHHDVQNWTVSRRGSDEDQDFVQAGPVEPNCLHVLLNKKRVHQHQLCCGKQMLKMPKQITQLPPRFYPHLSNHHTCCSYSRKSSLAKYSHKLHYLFKLRITIIGVINWARMT